MKRITLIILSACLLLFSQSISFAAVENVNAPTCSLGVYPFNPSANSSYGDAGKPFVKLLSGFKLGATSINDVYNIVSQADCKNRVTFDNSHIQGVSTLKNYYGGILTSNDLTQKVPRAIHEHTYINPSLQDNYYYKSLIYAFEINVENDGTNNTKPEELQCTTPFPATFSGSTADLLDCDGYVSNLYGGTRVTKQFSGGKTIITWKFGVDSSGNYFYTPGDQTKGINAVPYTLGNNAGLNNGLQTVDRNADLSNPMSPYRIFRPYVTMTSKDGLTDEFWSATTTSSVFLRNYQINAPNITRVDSQGKSNVYDPNIDFNAFFYITCKALDQENTGWCPAKVNGGEGESISVFDTVAKINGSRGRLFWFNIGSVASIWQQPITVPPPICRQLIAIFKDGTNTITKEAMVTGKTYNISIDNSASTKTDGSLITYYSIKVENASGAGSLTRDPSSPTSCPTTSGNTIIGTSGLASVDCKYNYTPNAGDKITIAAGPTDDQAACTIEQTIPTPPPTTCTDLTITPNPITANTPATFTVTPTFNPASSSIPLNYYWVSMNSGTFKNSSYDSQAASNPFLDTDNQTYYTGGIGGTRITVQGQSKGGTVYENCKAELTIPNIPPPPLCKDLNLLVNNLLSTNHPFLEIGKDYDLNAFPKTDQGSQIQALSWTEYGAGYLALNPLDALSYPGFCTQNIINDITITTPSICRYIYKGGQSPVDGFSVKAVPDNDNPNCKATSELFKPPVETPSCESLSYSYSPSPYNGTNADLTAIVKMTDKSHYTGTVSFVSGDGFGTFNGGFAPVTRENTNNFSTSTTNFNSTQTVHFSNGSGKSAINIFLPGQDALTCGISLPPTIIPPTQCILPPTIVRNGNTFTASGGDSAQYCWTISGNGNPLFSDESTSVQGNNVVIKEDYPNFNLHVEDCNQTYKNLCSDNFVQENTPKIEKKISKAYPLHYTNKISYSTKGESLTETVNYAINFTPANVKTDYSMTAKIYDPAFTGSIQGYKTPGDGGTKASSGKIDFSGIAETIKVSGFSTCRPDSTPIDHCYSLKTGYLVLQGITDPASITIEYSGQLHSGITTAECQAGTACNEQFINQSFVTDMQFCQAITNPATGKITYPCTYEVKPANQVCQFFYNDKGEKQAVSGNAKDCDMLKYTIATNTTIVELVCQYFLTRASGDVFLEDTLKYGIDVSKCYPFKNVSSTIVTPTTPIDFTHIKTGTPQVVTIGHEICSAGQSNFNEASFNKLPAETIASLKKLFGADLTTLSSQICEVGLVPGSDWDKDTIRAAIDQNIGKLTRWVSESNPSNVIDFTQLQSQAGGVYYYDGNLLGSEKTVTIDALSIPEGSGAYTIIVENADLQINGNIQYTNLNNVNATDPKQISSLGVIVIDGNMYVDPNVETLSGAYFIQRSDSNDISKGNIISGTKDNPGQKSDKGLTVYGSIYGNIGPLFENRQYSGDVAQDQGAITIRYDQRIIQNPPQGLAEILGNFSQSQVAQ